MAGCKQELCQQLAWVCVWPAAAAPHARGRRLPLPSPRPPSAGPATCSTHMAKWCLRLEPRRWPKIFSSRCSGSVLKLAASAGSAAPGSSSDASSASSSYSPSASIEGLSSATAWARRMAWRSQAAGPRRVGAWSARAPLPAAAAGGPAGAPAPGPAPAWGSSTSIIVLQAGGGSKAAPAAEQVPRRLLVARSRLQNVV